MLIEYECGLTSVSGYSRAARAHARALIETGVEVIIRNKRRDHVQCDVDDFWQPKLTTHVLGHEERSDADVKIWHETPEFYYPDPAIKNIALVAWETSEIPSTDLKGDPRLNWVAQLNKMDMVWVPCEHNKLALITSGVKKRIEVVRHPIYPPKDTYTPMVGKDATLSLLAAFQWQPRKDPLATILATYCTKAKARLILKTYGSTFEEGGSSIIKAVQDVKKNFHITPTNIVVPILAQLSDADMGKVFASGDVYLSTSRGEGCNLPALEAMVTGLPVIAPTHTAFKDFVDDHVGYPVESYQQPVYGMGHIPWYSPDQYWYQVDVYSVCRAIEQAEKDKVSGVLQEKGSAAKARVLKEYNPEVIGKRMKDLINELISG